jgi:hypothetical protein
MVTINFQQGDGVSRPDDASLTNDLIPPVNNLSEVPLVGDFIHFHPETGPEGVYKVISRLLEYKISGFKTSISANLVLEKQEEGVYRKIIKE